jgi:hypothetical protein
MQKCQKWLNSDYQDNFSISKNWIDFTEDYFLLRVLELGFKTFNFWPFLFFKNGLNFCHHCIPIFQKIILILYTQNWYFRTEVMLLVDLVLRSYSIKKNSNSKDLGVVHKLCWPDFGFLWPPIPLCWHFLPYEHWQKVHIFGLPTPLINIVCGRPLNLTLNLHAYFVRFNKVNSKSPNSLIAPSHFSTLKTSAMTSIMIH